MNNKEIIEKLRDDDQYYGEFGKQFLSNSDISTLLTNPLQLGERSGSSVPFMVGGYFHTAILEPDKLKKFKIIESSTRNTKKYKELSEGEICLLQHEVDMIEKMVDKIKSNDHVNDLLHGINVEYETPGTRQIGSNKWKGKADIINHDEQCIIDLKTTSDLNGFRYSARRYNYDSQAYIYQQLFGYDMIFIAIDKNTHQIGIYDCSPDFIARGEDKVAKANDAYDLFFKSPGFDPKQYFVNETL